MLGRSFVGIMFGKLGKHQEPQECVPLAAALRFLNWIIDGSSELPKEILAKNYMLLTPPNWFTELKAHQLTMRYGI